ncbi:MAG: hypothetical protein PHH26_05950 [Candidatus Thermoplasmatota archaeon]|nr:hypothetical protein [Candidatus Thermoplasmatota archaeon]
MDFERIPPTKQALSEALQLAKEIMDEIELNKSPLSNVALKTMRLAKLLNDFENQRIFEYEVSGYPQPTKDHDKFIDSLIKSNRVIEILETGKKCTSWYNGSISEIESQIKMDEITLSTSKNVNISSVYMDVRNFNRLLTSRKNLIYQYALKKYTELKFSEISDDVFSRIRSRVDSSIGKIIPDAEKEFVAIYDNLKSNNSVDWSNAVHGCRRILKALADKLYPVRQDKIDKNGNSIKLGDGNYINRLVAFVEEKSKSSRFNSIVGSHLDFIGDRLQSVSDSAQKGSHDTIVNKEEADRCVVFTYLLVGDILSLIDEKN